ncbi:MAG: ribonuclease III [Deltaproteobacteria bacterium]|nr:ribonuclease III [Deltaproteobacteria bacterium]
MALERAVLDLAARLGYEFRDPDRLRIALTHRSYVNENPDSGPDNERLEFLGDGVLDLAVSEILMELLGDAREGALSRAHSRVVSEHSLAQVARALDVGLALSLGKGEERTGGRDRPSMLADALEAILAAVYLDGGIAPVEEIVRRHFSRALSAVERGETVDAKTRLQEIVQERHRETPIYVVREATGPDHDKEFEVEILIAGEPWGRGSGRSKKAAEQAAARAALDRVAKERG